MQNDAEAKTKGPKVIDWKLTPIEVEKLGEFANDIGQSIVDVCTPLCIIQPPEGSLPTVDFNDPNLPPGEYDVPEPLEDRDDFAVYQDDAIFSPIEKQIATDLKKALDSKLPGGNWNVLVGHHLYTILNLLPADRTGKFLFGCMYIEVFQMNINPAMKTLIEAEALSRPSVMRAEPHAIGALIL